MKYSFDCCFFLIKGDVTIEEAYNIYDDFENLNAANIYTEPPDFNQFTVEDSGDEKAD